MDGGFFPGRGGRWGFFFFSEKESLDSGGCFSSCLDSHAIALVSLVSLATTSSEAVGGGEWGNWVTQWGSFLRRGVHHTHITLFFRVCSLWQSGGGQDRHRCYRTIAEALSKGPDSDTLFVFALTSRRRRRRTGSPWDGSRVRMMIYQS